MRSVTNGCDGGHILWHGSAEGANWTSNAVTGHLGSWYAKCAIMRRLVLFCRLTVTRDTRRLPARSSDEGNPTCDFSFEIRRFEYCYGSVASWG